MKAGMATVCVMVLSFVFTSAAKSTERSAPLAPSYGATAFEKLKTLVGEWDAPLGKNEVMTDIFRPMGSGTAILHEEWKNGEQLTATVFYLVGSELRADHFCDLGNQLHYVAVKSDDPNALSLELRDSTNLDTHPKHFHSVIVHFIDPDHHTQDWELMSPDTGAKNVRLVFTRKK
jgi:hypothetical protein